ncbi:RsmD family RNA methyltransferase [uncultured Helicobacter sp.]|uniref:RsmD family RNA methyltransferase n=1 Tax=uncultured Helicobacter sp. TaxID=175537 RepID=UPI00258E53B8|nr:RsmD family RNA methyltransferase [uncultured Helicobacter sp.]
MNLTKNSMKSSSSKTTYKMTHNTHKTTLHNTRSNHKKHSALKKITKKHQKSQKSNQSRSSQILQKSQSHSSRKSQKSRHIPVINMPKHLRIIGGKFRGLKLFAPLENIESHTESSLESSLKSNTKSNLDSNLESNLDSASSFVSASSHSLAHSSLCHSAYLTKSQTRPTKSILKESLFNTLGSAVIDCYFIEGFSGSGSVGIEAISRGAKRAVFFEKDKRAIELLKQNLGLLSKYSHTEMTEMYAEIFVGNSFIELPKFLRTLQNPSLLYLDPPFSIRQNYADIYENCANLIRTIDTPFVREIIIEHYSSYHFSTQIGMFLQTKTRKFGKSSLSYFTQGEQHG